MTWIPLLYSVLVVMATAIITGGAIGVYISAMVEAPEDTGMVVGAVVGGLLALGAIGMALITPGGISPSS